jgi:hypothetical protein
MSVPTLVMGGAVPALSTALPQPTTVMANAPANAVLSKRYSMRVFMWGSKN